MASLTRASAVAPLLLAAARARASAPNLSDDISEMSPAAARWVMRALTAALLLAVPACGEPEPPPAPPLSIIEHEAEAAEYRGELIGPTREAKTLAGEASARMAVTLRDPARDHVTFKLTKAANAITVRYSVPDGTTGTLAVSTGLELPLTSRYGWYYGGYPFSNDPSRGSAHHFYDHVRGLLDRTYDAGSSIVLRCSCTIDFAEFEQVSPGLSKPDGAVSVVDFGADPTGAADSSDAFDAALAGSRDVWIPAGTFRITRHLRVEDVRLRGAGMWHSILAGPGVGVYGRTGGVHLADFAIIGDVAERVDSAQLNGIGGAMGRGSIVERLFIQHTKVGMWLDGPFSGLTVRGNRIFDTAADGLNLHQGISEAVVEDNLIRNTGDDGLAMWSDRQPNHHNTFRRNTIQLPLLANGIGIYGGHDNVISDNVIADILIEGAGIQLANRFSGTVPLSGTTTLARNKVIRGGSRFPGIQTDVGAYFLFGKDSPIAAEIIMTDNTTLMSTFSGLHLFGQSVSDVAVSGLVVEQPGTVGVHLQSKGSASFSDSRIEGGVSMCLPFSLTVTASTGLDSPTCVG